MVTIKALKCDAEFKITGSTLNPDLVTSQLNVNASASWTAENLPKIAKNQFDVSESGWMLSSRGHLISKRSEDQLVWLLAQLSRFAEHRDSFKKMNFQIKLSAKCFATSEFLEIKFPKSLLVKLADFGVPLYLDSWANAELLELETAGEVEESVPLDVWVSAMLMHENLEPDVVTQLFEIKPTEAWLNGSVDKYGNARTWGYWEIASYSHVISSDLTDHLRWMLDFFEAREEPLGTLQRQFEGLTVNYHVRCAITTFNTTLFFDETLVMRLAKSNVNLNVLVCFK